VAFLKKLKDLFSGGSGPSQYSDANGFRLYFRCKACGEIVPVRVDRRNDLNRADGGPGVFLLHKEVMGSKRCFQLMHAEIWLDSGYKVVTADVTGGELVSEAEYEAYVASEEAPTQASEAATTQGAEVGEDT